MCFDHRTGSGKRKPLPQEQAPRDAGPSARYSSRSAIYSWVSRGRCGAIGLAPWAEDARSFPAWLEPVHSPACYPRRLPGPLFNARMLVASAHHILATNRLKRLAQRQAPESTQRIGAIILRPPLRPPPPHPAHFYSVGEEAKVLPRMVTPVKESKGTGKRKRWRGGGVLIKKK